MVDMGLDRLFEHSHWFCIGGTIRKPGIYDHRFYQASMMVILHFQTRLEEIPPSKAIKELGT
jgi:hypothetical protein